MNDCINAKGKSYFNPTKKAIRHHDAAFMSKADRKAARHGVRTGNGKGGRSTLGASLRHLNGEDRTSAVIRRTHKSPVKGGLRTLAACDYMHINPKSI